jgi:hypothetical protein
LSATAAVAVPRVHLPVVQLPRTRAECIDGPRPCPHTSCRHNLEGERRRRHGRPGRATVSDPQSCALDVAARAGATLEELAHIFGTTREAVRQAQVRAIRHVVLLLWDAGYLDLDELAAALQAADGGLLTPHDL